MKEAIEENVAFLVRLVIDYAAIMSFSLGGKDEPINDLVQAKAIYIEAAKKVDLASPRDDREQEDVEILFRQIRNLQGNRFKDDKEMIGVLGLSYFSVGRLLAGLMGNRRLAALGRAGAKKRYAAMRELEAWTLSEYRHGDWKSANQAAHALKDAVLDRSRTLEANLTESNAQRTIAEWINKGKKKAV